MADSSTQTGVGRTREFRLRRIYDAPRKADGHRILADRVWPRGLRKADAEIDDWAKDATPSSDLRKAYHSGDLDEQDFAAHYREELDDSGAARELAADLPKVVTLLTAAKDPQRGHLPVLRDVLTEAQKNR